MRFLNDSPPPYDLTYSDVFMVPGRGTRWGQQRALREKSIRKLRAFVAVGGRGPCRGRRMARERDGKTRMEASARLAQRARGAGFDRALARGSRVGHFPTPQAAGTLAQAGFRAAPRRSQLPARTQDVGLTS